MDFMELESIEGLRFPWNSWPPTRSDANDLVVPLSALYTPLLPLADLPLLGYDPLVCSSFGCRSALNPYARVDYRSALWICPFCHRRNPFPKSYAGIGDHNLPAELFPTYSTVEYTLSSPNPNFSSSSSSSSSTGSSSSSSFLSSSVNSSSMSSMSGVLGLDPGFVFVVDVCMEKEELEVVKGEILRVVARLPENVMVGLVSFGEMVWVHDLGFSECSRVLVFAGDRELSSEKILQLMGISHIPNRTLGVPQSLQKQGYLVPVSECEFNITTTLEDLISSPCAVPGHRPQRATGAAISTFIALLEGCSPNMGGRVMVFTSGPGTTGPGMIAETDLSQPIRTHRDIVTGRAPLSEKAKNFYRKVAQRLSDSSLVLDLFACSLDQVGAAELRFPVETSGGFMVLAESFESDQFKKCFRHIFKHEGTDHLNMNFDATLEVVVTKEIKICGAIGPCLSLGAKNSLVSEKEVGHGGTNLWRLSTLTNKTCIAFIFQVEGSRNADPGPVFFIQFKTRYKHGNGGYRLRVTTAARRWASARSPEITSGFDQEAAAAIMARLAILRAEEYHARDVIRWLDKMLILQSGLALRRAFGRETHSLLISSLLLWKS